MVKMSDFFLRKMVFGIRFTEKLRTSGKSERDYRSMNKNGIRVVSVLMSCKRNSQFSVRGMEYEDS